MKPSYGVIVGRFQVNDLHDGHMELFRQVRARHKTVVVFVGVHPAGLTVDHPLDYPTRKAMIQAKFPEFIVLPLRDTQDDDSWSSSLDYALSGVADFGDITLYGGRDSFVPHYHGRYKPVELTLMPDVAAIKGTDIRNAISNRVIESADFRAGMIYAAAHLWHRSSADRGHRDFQLRLHRASALVAAPVKRNGASSADTLRRSTAATRLAHALR